MLYRLSQMCSDSPYEIKDSKERANELFIIFTLERLEYFYIYLDSGKINDGKNKYEGGINESIFRGKIAQWE